ncbi:MAG: DUF2344 domain-containing protein [Actinobacteria bacterium]|nr:DUF2344 domain-containing protein [Actinomycetota bacterium]
MQTLKSVTIRFKFCKTGVFKYLSHLDILTVISRAVSRSGVRVKFSSGFNAKPKILLSNPIPLGVESNAEYGDIELLEDTGAGEFKDLMNKNLPQMMQISDAIKIDGKIPGIMSQIDLVCYEFEIGFKKDKNGTNRKKLPHNKNSPESSGIKFKTISEEQETILSALFDAKSGHCSSSGTIHRYEVLTLANNIFLLKIFGYAKILNGENRSVFKFNDFFRWLSEAAETHGFAILSSRKTEVYVMRQGRILTPLEAAFQV